MSLRAVIRSSFIKRVNCTLCFRQHVAATHTPSMTLRPIDARGYSTDPPQNPKFNLPNEYAAEVFRSLASNPPVMQALHDVIEAVNKRGIKLDREPSVSEMWQIMKDKEIIAALNHRTSPALILNRMFH